jgi:hypothetical protein
VSPTSRLRQYKHRNRAYKGNHATQGNQGHRANDGKHVAILTMTKTIKVAMVTKVTLASLVFNHTSLYYSLATGAIVHPTSQVSSSAILLLLPMLRI